MTLARLTARIARSRRHAGKCHAGVRFEKRGCMKVAGGEVIASHSRLQRYNGSARLFIRSHNGSYVRRAVWNWNSGNWSRANNCCVLIGRRSSFGESGLKEKPGSNLCRRRSLFIRESNASGLQTTSKAPPLATAHKI